MKAETADALSAAAEELGVELGIHGTYSGRGMYGSTTHGVECSPTAILALCACAGSSLGQAAADDETDYGDVKLSDFIEDLMRVRTDNMGRDDMIYY